MGIINFFLLYSPGTWSRATRLDWEVEEDQDVFAWGSGKGKNPRVWFCKPLIEWTSVTQQEDSTQGWKLMGWGHNAAAWIHNFSTAQSNSPSTCLYLLWSSLSVPWIKWKRPGSELELQQTSCTLSSCATNTSVRDVHCRVGFGAQIFLNSNKIKTLKPDWHKWYTQILHNIEWITLKF